MLGIRYELNHIKPVTITEVLSVAELEPREANACLIPFSIDAFHFDKPFFTGGRITTLMS